MMNMLERWDRYVFDNLEEFKSFFFPEGVRHISGVYWNGVVMCVAYIHTNTEYRLDMDVFGLTLWYEFMGNIGVNHGEERE